MQGGLTEVERYCKKKKKYKAKEKTLQNRTSCQRSVILITCQFDPASLRTFINLLARPFARKGRCLKVQ